MPIFGLRRLTPAHVALLQAAATVAGKAGAPVLVGGAVRDAWLARPSVDLDIAVPAGALTLAARVAERVRGTCVVLDAERGSARVVAGNVTLDVTDFRAPSLEADLALRDFTVNALAVELRALLRDGRAPIIDPTGGLADLKAGRLRPPSPRVLDDDPLRALRAIRFEATLGLRLTAAAARAVQAAAPALVQVSAERVRDELVSLLDLPDTARALRRADALGLLVVVFPEAQPMRATTQPAPHRFDVLEHSLRAVAGCDRIVARPQSLAPFGDELAAHLAAPLAGQVDRRRALKLAALLHDVSKPETRRRIGGRIRFFEHDVLGARRARAISERLRLPERVSALLERLVRHHLRPMHLAQAGEITHRARYRFYRDLADDTRDLLLLVLADSAAVTGVSPFAVWRQSTVVRDLLGGLAVEEQEAAAPPLLRGEDVMARYGLPPGPEVGRLLARAREAQGLGLVATRDDALSFLDSPADDP